MIDDFMEHLAIQTEPMEAFSLTYWCILVVIGMGAIFLAELLKHHKVQTEKVLFITGILLSVSEAWKEILLAYVRGWNYSWSDFPWQLCSIPMYLCVLYPLIQPMQETIAVFLMTYGMLGAVFAFAIPYGNLSKYVLLTVQSFAWHGALLFLAIYIFISRNKKIPISTYGKALLLYMGAACVASGWNWAFYKISDGSCNMFFFGPGNTGVDILNAIQEQWGWLLETILMAGATVFAGLFLCLGYNGLYGGYFRIKAYRAQQKQGKKSL